MAFKIRPEDFINIDGVWKYYPKDAQLNSKYPKVIMTNLTSLSRNQQNRILNHLSHALATINPEILNKLVHNLEVSHAHTYPTHILEYNVHNKQYAPEAKHENKLFMSPDSNLELLLGNSLYLHFLQHFKDKKKNGAFGPIHDSVLDEDIPGYSEKHYSSDMAQSLYNHYPKLLATYGSGLGHNFENLDNHKENFAKYIIKSLPQHIVAPDLAKLVTGETY